ncbi:hypothetical protein DdX_05353 [Ditylenchus destructor]|uniref:Uncharacterized protein n=1 Tax=Ditylenchus destructor TaxID=166010 RepID=A0AAD4NCJ5_9BILA|nr:hypothetical protein DdX_05353 [Ditylenchus destructor]
MPSKKRRQWKTKRFPRRFPLVKPKIDEEAKQLNQYFDELDDFELIVEQIGEDHYLTGMSANKSDPQPIDNLNATNDSSSWSIDKTNSRREDLVAPNANHTERSIVAKPRKTSTKSGSFSVFSKNSTSKTEFKAPENDENQPGPSTAPKSDTFAESEASLRLSFVNRGRYSLLDAAMAGPSRTSLQSPHFSTPRNISETSEKISETSSLKSTASMPMFSPVRKSVPKKSKLNYFKLLKPMLP